MKARSVLIIIVSSITICLVLSLTVFGYYMYLGWKENKIARDYKLSLYELNAKLFEKYIVVDLEAKIAKGGIFANQPIVEGTIKNTSNKKIYSLELRAVFYDSQNRAVYVDSFYPIGLEFESLIKLGNIVDKTENFLLAGDSISFKHRLENCPPIVLNYLRSQLLFAKKEDIEPLAMEYKIQGADIR